MGARTWAWVHALAHVPAEQHKVSRAAQAHYQGAGALAYVGPADKLSLSLVCMPSAWSREWVTGACTAHDLQRRSRGSPLLQMTYFTGATDLCMLMRNHPHLQAQRAGDACCVHLPAAHQEATAAGGDALAAQLGQRVCGALAHAHVVGGDPGGQALQARGAAGRSSWGGVAGRWGRVGGSGGGVACGRGWRGRVRRGRGGVAAGSAGLRLGTETGLIDVAGC